MKKSSLLIGTPDEILEELQPTFKLAVATFGSLEDQIERISFDGALMENSALGLIVFLSQTTTKDGSNGEIPEISLGITSQYVCITTGD